MAAGALALAFRRLPVSILMACVIGFTFVAMLVPFFSSQRIYVWLGIMVSVYLARYLVWRSWNRTLPGLADTRRWQVLFGVGAALAGGSWAFGGVYLLPEAGQLETILLLVAVLVVSSTAANTLGAQFGAMIAFLGSSILPVAVALLIGGGDIERMTALALLCWFIAMSAAGHQTHASTLLLIRTELELSHAFTETASARRLAEASSRAKSQFLANMSHEVRTPLNGVLGLAELLARGTLDPEQRKQIQLLRQSGEHLLHIVNEILDLSKIEAGKLELAATDFDLRMLIEQCAALVRPAVQRRRLAFELDIAPDVPRWVTADPYRIRQILLNLLSNAEKFTESGSVSLCVAREDVAYVPPVSGGSPHSTPVRFTILDTGIGIRTEDAERIFSAFTQAEESDTRRFSGTGLGLAVCRQLAQLMGGDVHYAPRATGGSAFSVLLPVPLRPHNTEDSEWDDQHFNAGSNQHRAAAQASTQASAQAAKKSSRFAGRVLLVEDNPVNQEVISAMLETLGLEVVRAANGQQAVEFALAGGIRLIFMDCQMPVMDGYTATARIRTHSCMDELLRPLPIIALTANAYAEDRARALESGMDDFVAKPLGIDDLQRVLSTWLDQVPAASNSIVHALPMRAGSAASGYLQL